MSSWTRNVSTPNDLALSQLPTPNVPYGALGVGSSVRGLEVGNWRLGAAVFAILVFAAANLNAASGRPISFRAESGRTVNGMLFDADQRPAPAVVLLPMLGRTKDDWQNVAQKLADAKNPAPAIAPPPSTLPG